MNEQVPSKNKLPLIEWARDRFERCVRLARTEEPADQDEAFEDATYFRELLVILERPAHEPLPGHLRQGMESVDAHELTVPAIRERATAFNHWFRTNGGFKGYEAQAIDSLLDFIDALTKEVGHE